MFSTHLRVLVRDSDSVLQLELITSLLVKKGNKQVNNSIVARECLFLG